MHQLTRPDWLIEEPDEVYHGKAKEFLSSHQLNDFRKCPYLYWKKHSGLIADKDSSAYAFGRAAHTLILEGRQTFEQRYAVGGPINPRTGKPYGSGTKAFAQWSADQGKPVVTDDEFVILEMMEQAVLTHPCAPKFITSGFAEGVCRSPYLGIPSQIRMDYLHPSYGIVDLKTCDDLTWFESDARRYGYLHQMAFYRAVLKETMGSKASVHILAVEKKQPFRCGIWKVSGDALDFAQAENESAIRLLKECCSEQIWPTGYEDIRIYDTV
ncbi:Exodeoxyribonuclease 8 [Anaerohalosphaera lusitana]|uniref:Exodeoxyribonuclease 8 n=1 Tax=Anaerohalosphaera lusitana TaxID=1936003 RepID=A0A1U9NJ27_9BACT|nr:PD-(D/E)XK nuclease-like domain-containing protein [Anaerohalosphaera lusitana]AQT67921.1 Exodeoxyribonuclease 8 [Anaerohalosphaera lusitana]